MTITVNGKTFEIIYLGSGTGSSVHHVWEVAGCSFSTPLGTFANTQDGVNKAMEAINNYAAALAA